MKWTLHTFGPWGTTDTQTFCSEKGFHVQRQMIDGGCAILIKKDGEVYDYYSWPKIISLKESDDIMENPCKEIDIKENAHIDVYHRKLREEQDESTSTDIS